ncbi:MAG: dihydropteroate synthase [Betaproteobacteria bacterium]
MTWAFPPRAPYALPLPGGELRVGERPLVMGILNVTPDSFASSPMTDPAAAAEAALRMDAEGADLIDVGGESTRPGAAAVPLDEELARVLPVVRAIAGRLRAPISIDTWRAAVARAALDAGASMVNDVSGLLYDRELAGVVAARGAAIVLMHTRGRPDTMGREAVYRDLIAEVTAELAAAVTRAVEGGVPREAIVVDPGIGFAKRPHHSYGVLARLPDIAEALDRPVLVGPSRKSFLQEASGGAPPSGRDWATAAAVTAAVLGGAHIVRVHAVAEMAQVARAAEEIRRGLQATARSEQP